MKTKKEKKPILTNESKITLIVLLLGLSIYLGLNYQKLFPKTPITVLSQSESDLIQISKLNFSSKIIYSDAKTEKDAQGQLDQGLVHLKDTAMPGEAGNVFLVGWDNLDFFRNQIEAGDQISIFENSKRFDYYVYETRVVEPTELWITSQITDGQKVLTLEFPLAGSSSGQKYLILARQSK